MSESILLSYAHPDDESFMLAGAIAKYADRGVAIAMSTATLGEEGSTGSPPLCPRDELGRVREAELRAAAEILGIRDLHLLGYRDRQLASAPADEIRGKLVALLRRYRPQIVVTFDPNGMNLHTDHVAISRFTSDAIAAAADPRWFPEHGPVHQVERLLWTPPLRVYDLGRMENRAAAPGVDFLIDIRPWRERKAAALRAHRTQRASVDRHFFQTPDCDARLSFEALRQAWGPPLASRPSDDLFDA